ncbi:MAG TPA: YihY/virulence factor BrkB family protein [Gammaproteobacteria bacterium]|nr:YihY/virulence factor BrkB family protein [Gammaproteobacteria bacterium]
MANAQYRRRGRRAESPSEIPPAGWMDILRRVKQQMGDHNLSLVAAGAAFYWLLAVFPALAALVSLYGLFNDPQTVQQQMQGIQSVMPQEAAGLINQQLTRIVMTGSQALGIGAALGFLLALWSATKGVSSMMTALNIVYDEKEKRGFFKSAGLALLLTLGLLLFVIVALVGIAVIPAALAAGLSGPLATIVNWIRWPLLAVASIFALDVLYRYGASRENASWRWVTWGAVVATVLWLGGSALFSWYVSSFGSYNETYGSVAAVAVLMMWFWVSAYVVLLGAQLNAEMEHQTVKDTTTGKPEPMGRRGAHVADTIGEGADTRGTDGSRDAHAQAEEPGFDDRRHGARRRRAGR